MMIIWLGIAFLLGAFLGAIVTFVLIEERK